MSSLYCNVFNHDNLKETYFRYIYEILGDINDGKKLTDILHNI